MVRYISPVLIRRRGPEKCLARKRKRENRHQKHRVRYVAVLVKLYTLCLQLLLWVVCKGGSSTLPNTPAHGPKPPSPLASSATLSIDPASTTSKSTNLPINKLNKLGVKVLGHLKRALKMPILTRSASATFTNKSYLTPHTPPSTHPRALVAMTPLPSLLDTMFEAAKRKKRSTSLQLESKVDDPFALRSIPEVPEQPSSDPVGVHDVRQSSDAPTEVDEPEPKVVVHQPLATCDDMDCEETPIIFSVPVNPVPPAPTLPPSASASFPPCAYGDVFTTFPTSNHLPVYQHASSSVTYPPTNQELLLLSESSNSATSPHPAIYYNPPSTSANLGLHFPPQEQAPFQPPQVNKVPQHIEIIQHNVAFPQHPALPPSAYPTTSPVLSASAPLQNIMQPAVFPVLSHSLPAFTTIPTYPGPDCQRQESTFFHHPHPSTPSETYYYPTFVPRAQQRIDPDESFAWWFHPRPRLSRWLIREMERQREMDRIAEPYLARLREISRQKKAEAEACALAGQERTNRAQEEQGKSWWDFLREDGKKAQKELKEVERQQRSEEKRQARKNAHEERTRRKSRENAQPEGQEPEASVSPRRRSTGRAKPYSIPPPASRSPRRSYFMPGGFHDLISSP